MKKLFYYFVICSAIGGILSLFFALLPGLQMGANAFLRGISGGYYEEAYSLLSAETKEVTSLQRFKAIVSEPRYKKFQNAAWEPPIYNQAKDKAKLRGIINTENNLKYRIEFHFVKEGTGFWDQKWAVVYFGDPTNR